MRIFIQAVQCGQMRVILYQQLHYKVSKRPKLNLSTITPSEGQGAKFLYIYPPV